MFSASFKSQSIPPTTTDHKIPTLQNGNVTILGSGNIGRLLALEWALSGVKVFVVDVNEGAIAAAKEVVGKRAGTRVVSEEEKLSVLDRISYVCGDVGNDPVVNQILATSNLVIEALPEIADLKRSILLKLDGIVPLTVPISTTSSSIPMSELIEATTHKGRFLNTHPLQYGMAPIEIMPSLATTPEVTNEVARLFAEIGMIPIMVHKENIGFIFNIVWRRIKQQTLDLVERGVATPHEFDRLWMMAFKTQIGPFGVMDMVGLKVVRDIEAQYFAKSGDPSDAPPMFLSKMVDEGRLGIATGEGFYRYPNPAYAKPGFLERGESRSAEENLLPIRETLIGSWSLVSFVAEITESGEQVFPMGVTPKGKLLYNIDGSMSVYLSSTENRQRFESQDPLGATDDEKTRTYTEFFSYFGEFSICNGRILHKIDACSFPNWAGSVQIRYASLDPEGRLILTTPPLLVKGETGVQKLVWERKR
jgi:3-hydroxybutyryl-CoA dehydrogenase